MTVHPLSRSQTRAIREAMRLFAEDDLAHGVLPTAQRPCVRCRRNRPAAGFIHYTDGALCNSCATSYELARIRHAVASVGEFIAG